MVLQRFRVSFGKWIYSWWYRIRQLLGHHCRAVPFAPNPWFRPARRPRGGGNPKPDWVVNAVLRLYAEGGKSYRGVEKEFNRLYAHQGMSVSLNTVYAWIQKSIPEGERIRLATRNRFPPFSPANQRWCLDGTGKRDVHGVGHTILGIIDHGTRLNLTMVRLLHANASTILKHLTEATLKFGKPQCIRTDNDSVFHSAPFELGLAALGIRHEFSQPGKPWQNGRIERLFLTLKQRLNNVVPLDELALDRLLAEFSIWYNTARPHQHLHGLTPAEVWCGIDPYRRPPNNVLRFEFWDGLLRGFYLRH